MPLIGFRNIFILILAHFHAVCFYSSLFLWFYSSNACCDALNWCTMFLRRHLNVSCANLWFSSCPYHTLRVCLITRCPTRALMRHGFLNCFSLFKANASIFSLSSSFVELTIMPPMAIGTYRDNERAVKNARSSGVNYISGLNDVIVPTQSIVASSSTSSSLSFSTRYMSELLKWFSICSRPKSGYS